jgi:peptide/nickel transport system substrate-binding protein
VNRSSNVLSRRALLRYAATGALTIGAGGILAGCSRDDEQPTTPASRGGTLRAALAAGPGTESLDPHFAQYNASNQARIFNMYDSLVRYGADGKPQPQLAQELTPDAAATAWTLRLPAGATFHNGRPVTADDVIASLRRAADPKSILASSYAFVDLAGIKKVDERTVLIPTKVPVAILPDLLADASPVVPADFDPAKPVGSGPFSLQAFQVGRATQFGRFADYWDDPATLDQLTVANIVDPAARLNALKAGQVDLVDAVPGAQARTLSGGTGLLVSEGAGWGGFVMNCATGPFTDVRVRQAMRLIVDRPAMVQQVLAGYGRPGNDIYSPADPAKIDDSIPQREQNLDEAKSLLRAAGHADLKIELTTAPIRTGAVEMCTVLAEQAKAAGVTITVRPMDVNAFHQGVRTYPFTVTTANTLGSSFIRFSLSSTMSTGAYNQAGFSDPEFDGLVNQAVAERDEGKRSELIHQAQRIFHDRGGYIVWGFANFLDGLSSKVDGINPHTVTQLGGYQFKSAAIAS